MKIAFALSHLTALLTALAIGFAANAQLAQAVECKNHYILSEPCERKLEIAWSPIPDSLLAHGPGHGATLLTDGRVLVVGGGMAIGHDRSPAVGAEIFDPVSRTWNLTAPMNLPRLIWTQAIRLLDGRVLVLGGESIYQLTGGGEIFDPASGKWTATARPIIARVAFTATLLADGSVLLVGGVDANDETIAMAEIYNPGSDSWRATGSLLEARYGHTATLLGDGRVLVVGGNAEDFFQNAATLAEVFDPQTGAWTEVGRIPRGWLNTATLLDDGRVLFAGGTMHYCPSTGGWCSETTVESTDVHDPRTSAWAEVPPPMSPRYDHLAVPVPGSGVLLLGGKVGVTPVPSYSVAPVDRIELFSPETNAWTDVPSINPAPAAPSNYHSATPLADGSVLLVGAVEGKRAALLRYSGGRMGRPDSTKK